MRDVPTVDQLVRRIIDQAEEVIERRLSASYSGAGTQPD